MLARSQIFKHKNPLSGPCKKKIFESCMIRKFSFYRDCGIGHESLSIFVRCAPNLLSVLDPDSAVVLDDVSRNMLPSFNSRRKWNYSLSSLHKYKNQLNHFGWADFCTCGDLRTLNQHIEKWQGSNLSELLFNLKQVQSQLAWCGRI